MKKKLSKFMALAMTGIMLCAPLTVNAADDDYAEGTTTGSGNVEGILNKEVFKVDLPVIPEDGSDDTFNFILDPQGLIKDTNAAAYDGASFDSKAAGLYFKNTDGTDTWYSAQSDYLKAINMSTVPVDISITAAFGGATKRADNKDIYLTTDEYFTDDTDTTLYLALQTDWKDWVPFDAQSWKATVSQTLNAAPSDAYYVEYDADSSEYKYTLTEGYSKFDAIQFGLYGMCNMAGDWTGAEAVAPEIEVTWTLEKHVD